MAGIGPTILQLRSAVEEGCQYNQTLQFQDSVLYPAGRDALFEMPMILADVRPVCGVGGHRRVGWVESLRGPPEWQARWAS
jgi:hypothetical protein